MYLCIKKRMNKTINKIKNFCHGPIASNVIAGLIVSFVIFLGKRLYSFIIPTICTVFSKLISRFYDENYKYRRFVIIIFFDNTNLCFIFNIVAYIRIQDFLQNYQKCIEQEE